MKNRITWIGLKSSKAIEESIRISIEGLNKFSSSVNSSRVALTHSESQNPSCKAEFIFFISGREFVSASSDNDMYAAITLASDKAVSQIKRFESKRRTNRRSSARTNMFDMSEEQLATA